MFTTTFIGYCYFKEDTSCTLVNDTNQVYYQAYFKQIDPNSEPSTWTTTPKQITKQGYYSVSIEDFNFLNIGSTYKRNKDKIYICFWKGDTNRNSNLITHACFIETEFGSDVIQMDVTLEPIRFPMITNYTMTEKNIFTNIDYTMSENSEADYSFHLSNCGYSPKLQGQLYEYEGVLIFQGHQIIKTVYDWGDECVFESQPNSYNTHRYLIAGEYYQKIRVFETWNSYAEQIQQVKVKYNTPNIDFTWSPLKIKGATIVDFTNTSEDLDLRSDVVYMFDWIINDLTINNEDNSKFYANKPKQFSPSMTYASSGQKEVTLTCYWNDGFENQISTITKILEVEEYQITVDFDYEPKLIDSRNVEVVFTNTSIDEDNKIDSIQWQISDNYDIFNPNNPSFEIEKTTNMNISDWISKDINLNHKFQTLDVSKVLLNVKYFDGFKFQTINIEKPIEKVEKHLSIDFEINSPIIGKTLSTFRNTTLDLENLQIIENWKINDKDELDENHITEWFNKPVNYNLEYTFKYPSRKPKEPVNNNKEVELEVMYDNGWENNKKLSIIKYFEASPIEVIGEIHIKEQNV